MKKRYLLTRSASVTLYGRAGSIKQVGKIYELGAMQGAKTMFIMDTPANAASPGWHRVITNPKDYHLPITTAEGGVVDKNQAILIPSRDCPVVTIVNRRSGQIGAVRAGREQLIDRRSLCCSYQGVIERLISALKISDGKEAKAYVTGGINAYYFDHDDFSFIEPFEKFYGPSVIEDKTRGTLDMFRVITLKLASYGITDVESDGLCTYATEWLGSRRAERTGIPKKIQSNWVLVANS